MIWIRFLTNSVGGNCEHAFSYRKSKFFIKFPKHPKRCAGHSKENRFCFWNLHSDGFGPGVLIKHNTWALVTNSDLCGKGFLWFSMLPAISIFSEKPCLRMIIWKCNDVFSTFHKKRWLLNWLSHEMLKFLICSWKIWMRNPI